MISSCSPRLDQPEILPVGGEIVLTGRRLGTREEGAVFFAGQELGWQQIRSWNPSKIELQFWSGTGDGLLQVRRRGLYSNAVLLSFEREHSPSQPLYLPVIDRVETGKRTGMLVTIKGSDFGLFAFRKRVLWQHTDQEFATELLRPGQLLQWRQDSVQFVAPGWGDALVQVRRGRLQSNRVEVSLPRQSGHEVSGAAKTHTIRQIVYLEKSDAEVMVYLSLPMGDDGQEILRLRDGSAAIDDYHSFMLAPQQGVARVITVRVLERWAELDDEQPTDYLANPLLTVYRQANEQFPSRDREVLRYARRAAGRQDEIYQRVIALYRDFIGRFRVQSVPVTWVSRVEPYRDFAPILRRPEAGAEELVRLLTTLYRSLDVPARMFFGLKIRDDSAQPYYWLQIFLPRYGWFDVDPLRDLGTEGELQGWGHRHNDLISFASEKRTGGELDVSGKGGWRFSYSSTPISYGDQVFSGLVGVETN